MQQVKVVQSGGADATLTKIHKSRKNTTTTSVTNKQNQYHKMK